MCIVLLPLVIQQQLALEIAKLLYTSNCRGVRRRRTLFRPFAACDCGECDDLEEKGIIKWSWFLWMTDENVICEGTMRCVSIKEDKACVVRNLQYNEQQCVAVKTWLL